MKAGAQAIYLAESRAQAVVAFRALPLALGSSVLPRWSGGLQQDLPELLSFFACPGTCGANSVPPNVIERCFVRSPPPHPTHGLICQRRKRRPHHLLTFQRFNLEWKTRPLNLFTQAA